MNCESFFHPRSPCIFPSKLSLPQGSTYRIPPCSALTNMDCYATSMSDAGPSSHKYADFHALVYPQSISPRDDICTYLTGHGCNEATYKPIPISSSTHHHFSGMFDPDSFDDYCTNFFHPDTPSSASSASEVMTPISSRGETEFPAIASGGGDVDMDAFPGGQIHYDRGAASTPLDFSELLLATSKSTSGDAPVEWPELLATMCIEHPEAVQWFAEMGGFQHDLDQIQVAAPPHEHDPVMQSQIPTIYPHQPSDTLSDFMSSFDNPPSSSSVAPTSAPHSPYPLHPPSIPIPLHHPRPVRPIPQIPLKDLAAVALRLGKARGPRGSTESLSSLPLLCRPVADAVRYQRKPFSAADVNTDR